MRTFSFYVLAAALFGILLPITPIRAQTLQPIITFTANPQSVTQGGSSTLNWQTQYATSCTASGGWTGSLSTNGAQSVTVSTTTSYTLVCMGSGGSATSTISITIATTTPTPTPTPSPIPTPTPTPPPAPNPTIPLCEISRTLKVGARGDDVKCLQRYLNWAGFRIALIGSGSPGNETTYFGNLTRQAVMRWQEANRAEVLTPLGLPNGTGVFGMASFNAYVRIVRIALGVGS